MVLSPQSLHLSRSKNRHGCRTQYDGVISLPTLLTTLLAFSISVSWFCHHRACISLGARIGTDTGCAGCRRVEERFNVKNTHTSSTPSVRPDSWDTSSVVTKLRHRELYVVPRAYRRITVVPPHRVAIMYPPWRWCDRQYKQTKETNKTKLT